MDMLSVSHLRDDVPACSACALRASCRAPVPGKFQGPPDELQAVLVGEAPGRDEDRLGEPFVGRTGRGELDRLLLYVARVPRQSLYITNTVKCRPPNNRDPKPAELEACFPFLVEELSNLDPDRPVVAVGRFSVRALLGRNVDLETVHGVPQTVLLPDGTRRVVLPAYHPAAGFRSQRSLIRIQHDFAVMGELIRGNTNAPRDAFVDREDYVVLDDPGDVLSYLAGHPLCGVDTESEDGIPWSVQLSVSPGSGILVHSWETAALEAVKSYLESADTFTVLQNALHDLPVLKRMDITPSRYTDTMLMAYLLQTEPMGLKALAYRHAGMEMHAYSDIIRDASHRKAMAYLAETVSRDWRDPEPKLEWTKDGQPHIKQPQNIKKKAARILWDEFNKGSDPRERWGGIEASEGRGQVEAVLGPMPEAWLSDADYNEALHYACRDADATLRIYEPLRARILQYDGLGTVLDWDLGAMEMALDMMETGIGIDPDYLRELGAYFHFRAGSCEEDGQQYVPPDSSRVSFSSPQQVGLFLFETLKLNKKATKKTALGYATGDEILSKIENDHPVVPLIKEYRKFRKLADTYANKIPDRMHPDGRVRCRIKITSTATGRISTSEPNLMAVPTRTEEGKMIRRGFVAAPGCVLTASDFSQIEMRIAACASGDAEMLRCFREELDIHSQTAMRIFGLSSEDQVDKMKHRYPCKRVGFGILYGITAQGLLELLLAEGLTEWTLEACADLIEAWFGVYRGVHNYREAVKLHARRYGYVRDLWGRIRLVPGVRSSDKRTRLEAEREACNAPVQMGAADVMKAAMAKLVPVYRQWQREGFYIRPLLQIHDDLVFEMEEDPAPWLLRGVADVMEHAVALPLPTPVDPEMGYDWARMTPLEDWM